MSIYFKIIFKFPDNGLKYGTMLNYGSRNMRKNARNL